jgi:hypothetical protein
MKIPVPFHARVFKSAKAGQLRESLSLEDIRLHEFLRERRGARGQMP